MTTETEQEFRVLAGAPVHYARMPVAEYGTRGKPRPFYSTKKMFRTLDACFAELWSRNPYGVAEVVVSAGAYVKKAGYHGRGEAFDLDAIFWGQRNFVTLHYPNDKPFYLAVDAVCRKHFGTVLNYHFNAAHHDHLHLDLGQPGFSKKATSEVKFLQMAANELFGEHVGVDGVWGPQTEDATANALAKAGIKGKIETKWLDFLDAVADEGFGREEHSLVAGPA